VVVVVGLAGRLDAEGRDRRTETRTALELDASATRRPTPQAAPEHVTLDEPDPPPAAVAGIPLWVRGHAAPSVPEVIVALVDGESEIARQTVRPSSKGRFSAVFTLRPPRPRMELTVVAVGRDSNAAPVSTSRRAVLVAALDGRAGAAVATATERPRLGEDGVLGSRGVDVAALPRPTPAPAPPGWGWPVGRLAWQANPVQR
jgi:hypothetical protein